MPFVIDDCTPETRWNMVVQHLTLQSVYLLKKYIISVKVLIEYICLHRSEKLISANKALNCSQLYMQNSDHFGHCLSVVDYYSRKSKASVDECPKKSIKTWKY